jgi:hypothetical protein
MMAAEHAAKLAGFEVVINRSPRIVGQPARRLIGEIAHKSE